MMMSHTFVAAPPTSCERRCEGTAAEEEEEPSSPMPGGKPTRRTTRNDGRSCWSIWQRGCRAAAFRRTTPWEGRADEEVYPVTVQGADSPIASHLLGSHVLMRLSFLPSVVRPF